MVLITCVYKGCFTSHMLCLNLLGKTGSGYKIIYAFKMDNDCNMFMHNLLIFYFLFLTAEITVSILNNKSDSLLPNMEMPNEIKLATHLGE